jgi:hypothetical protein
MATKYCIYKKPYGDIEVWEYIDDLEEACQYWYIRDVIEKYGVDEVMPIVMNKVGGYHTFYKPDCIAIIESDTWPSIASHYDLFKSIINSKNFNYGWIDPLGNTYKCQMYGHTSLAKDLVTLNYAEEYSKSKLVKEHIDAPDDFLLSKGWIKVLNGKPSCVYNDDTVTKKALKKLLEIESR